jgi:signal transduction histidine kinase
LRLRKKTALVIVVITLVVFSIISGIVSTILIARFTQLERENVNQNIQRSVNAISDDIAGLERTDCDLAVSDDTYQFVQNPQQGQAYIQANLLDPTLIDIKVDVILYFNQTGNIVYSKAINSDNIGTQVPQDVLDAIEANTELWNYTTLNGQTDGILSVPEGLLMVASNPILTSEGLGPIIGALVMGRYINDREISDLSALLRLPLTIQNLTNPQLPTDFQKALLLMPKGESFCVQPLGANLVGGYATVKGFSGSPVLILRIELSRDIYNQGQQDILYLCLALGLVCIVFGSTIMLLMEKVVLTPLSELDKEVKSICKDTKGSKRLRSRGNDELASLGASINEMVSALEKSQRLATIGELTTAIAHDLRNPMQGINAAVHYLRTKMGLPTDEKTVKMLNFIEKDIRYSDRIICQLLEYSEPMYLEFHHTTPEEIVKQALHLARIPENVQVISEAQDNLKISVDEQKIRTVFCHLIENAIEAMPEGGILRIESTSLNGNVTFRLSDTGVGMPQELLCKLWSPLFTTKAKGMGLSLSTSKRIVEAHGGSISVQSTVGEGSTFTVTIPQQSGPNLHETKEIDEMATKRKR